MAYVKIYFNFRQFEQTHSMENVIYNELRMRGYSVDVGVIPIAERNQEGKVIRKQLEVDFVCNLGSSRYYIQLAYSLPDETKRTQEIRPFRKIDDSFKKIVITKDIEQSFSISRKEQMPFSIKAKSITLRSFFTAPLSKNLSHFRKRYIGGTSYVIIKSRNLQVSGFPGFLIFYKKTVKHFSLSNPADRHSFPERYDILSGKFLENYFFM